jgi:uncharacterized protein (DUF433 family)
MNETPARQLVDLGRQRRYPLPQAARIAHVHTGTLRRWVAGYAYRRSGESVRQPPILRDVASPDVLSFFDLLEAAFLSAYRREGISLQSLRRALDFASKELQLDRPLLYHEFLHDGKDLFAVYEEVSGERGLLNVSRGGQATWPEVVWEYLRELEYEWDIAIRWWPLGSGRTVIIDPRFSFGRPIVASKKIRTEILAERWQAAEPIELIAEDFGLSSQEVEDALRFEVLDSAAAA